MRTRGGVRVAGGLGVGFGFGSRLVSLLGLGFELGLALLGFRCWLSFS